MKVIDAGVMVDVVAGRVGAEELGAELATTHLLDSEVVQALRRLVRRGEMSDALAADGLQLLAGIAIDRHPARPHLARIWELRHTLTAYDATYVALAEALDVDALLTTDARLARAPGIRCSVRVV